MRVRYLGQACTIVEAGGRTIVVDPWLTEGAYLGTWWHSHLLRDAGIGPASLPAHVDLVLLSHEHEDHADPATLAHLRRDVPLVVCRFATDRFRRHLERLGLRNVREVASGETLDLGGGVRVTVYGSAEYTNDAAFVIEGDGRRVFNETDCKLPFRDLERIAAAGVDIGFYMFSGANWFPIRYEYEDGIMRQLVARRRAALLRSFVQRVKLTRPRVAVPSAGPCSVLDPALFHLNDPAYGIFLDPADAVRALGASGAPAQALALAPGDVWDADRGAELAAPAAFRGPRDAYLADAAARVAAGVRRARAAEEPAGPDLGAHVERYFADRIAALSPGMRARIGARVWLRVTGPQGGDWTLDFAAAEAPVRAGAVADWTYRIEVEDRVLHPFVSGRREFLEDLFLSMRVRLARRPDVYNEPLYHFFYDPHPLRLDAWYDAH